MGCIVEVDVSLSEVPADGAATQEERTLITG